MKIYQPKEIEYNSPNLQYLDDTVNFLQKRHDDALTISTKLKESISQLDLNEEDEWFRRELYNNLQTVIDENSDYNNIGNSYNDIIKYSGELLTNPMLTGRLKSQKAFREFTETIDKTNMPDSFKRYYKDKNKYTYSDATDSNGKTIEGKIWSPTAIPTNIISLNDLFKKAMDSIQEEVGYGTTIQWLDANGNPTTDPALAVDGVMYRQFESKYERIGKDKIRQAIDRTIAETPGARESLDQEYDVARWLYDNKQVGDDYISNTAALDSNNNLLTRQQYIDRLLDKGSELRAYDKSITKTSYGNGLATFKKWESEQEQKQILNQLQDGNLTGSLQDYFPIETSRSMLLNVSVNPGETARTSMLSALGGLQEIANQYGITTPIINTKESFENIIKELDSKNINTNDKTLIQMYYNMYKNNYENYQRIIESIPEEKRKEYIGALRLINGENIDGNESNIESNFIDYTNRLYDGEENLTVTFNNSIDYNRIVSTLFGNNNPESIGITINDDDKSIIIPNNSKIILPKLFTLMGRIKDSNQNQVTISNGKMTIDYFNNYAKDIQTFSDTNEDNILFRLNKDSDILTDAQNKFNYSSYVNILAKNYSDATKIISKYDEKFKLDGKEVQIPLFTLQGNTFTNVFSKQLYAAGLIDSTELNNISKKAEEVLLNSLSTVNFANYPMYITASDSNPATYIESSSDRNTEGMTIKQKIKNGLCTVMPATADLAADPKTEKLGGYYIITYKENKGDKGKVEKMYYVPGVGESNIQSSLLNDDRLVIKNGLSYTKATKGIDYISHERYNSSIGDIYLDGNSEVNDAFDLYINNQYVSSVDIGDATNLKYLLKTFDIIKSTAKGYNTREDRITYLSKNTVLQTLDNLTNIIINCTGYDKDYVENMIADELSD